MRVRGCVGGGGGSGGGGGHSFCCHRGSGDNHPRRAGCGAPPVQLQGARWCRGVQPMRRLHCGWRGAATTGTPAVAASAAAPPLRSTSGVAGASARARGGRDGPAPNVHGTHRRHREHRLVGGLEVLVSAAALGPRGAHGVACVAAAVGTSLPRRRTSLRASTRETRLRGLCPWRS